MRLGFWNRLAVVATVLACIIAPTWIWLSINDDIFDSRAVWHKHCVAAAEHRPTAEAMAEAHSKCMDDLTAPTGLGWPEWWEFVGGTLMACLLIYLLVWGVVLTARWVWKGRSANA